MLVLLLDKDLVCDAISVIKTIQESLRKARRELKVDWGSIAELHASNGLGGDPDGHEMLEVKASPKTHGSWLDSGDDEQLEVDIQAMRS